MFFIQFLIIESTLDFLLVLVFLTGVEFVVLVVLDTGFYIKEKGKKDLLFI